MLSNNQQDQLLPVSLDCSLLIAPSVFSHNIVSERTVIYVQLVAANQLYQLCLCDSFIYSSNSQDAELKGSANTIKKKTNGGFFRQALLEIRGADFETVYSGQSTRHTDDERLRRTLDVGNNSIAHLGQVNHKLCSSMNAYAKMF